MWTELLPWYSDVYTAVCPVFLGHFCFARNPGGLHRDEALHDRQRLSPWLLLLHHTRTHAHLGTSWHAGMLFISFWDNVNLSRVMNTVPVWLPVPSMLFSSSLSATSSPQVLFLSYLLLCPVFPYNRLTFQRGNTQLPYAFLRYQIKWITLHSEAWFSAFQSYIRSA